MYDFKLNYYQRGLQFIGSQYDYISLGSTLIIDAAAYVKVRGFPMRSGGEDFYVLNKLAKVGRIQQPKEPVVRINIRFSDRVPFGTGPAIKKIKQLQSADEKLTYYHPEIFHILKKWHFSLSNYYLKKILPECDYGLNQHWQIESVVSQAMQQIKSKTRWHQFVHEWFDAFKILKSVHFLGSKYQSIPYGQLIALPHYQNLKYRTFHSDLRL